MAIPVCPKCESQKVIKSGVVGGRQRFQCKRCAYYFTVNKVGKAIDPYYVVKALQLYLEGISYREIERILGISHVTIMNWVKKYRIKPVAHYDYRPTYKILSHSELIGYMQNREELSGAGMVLTEVGDKFMLIKWERFRD